MRSLHWFQWRLRWAWRKLRDDIDLKGWCLVLACDPEPSEAGAPVVGPLAICRRCGHFVRLDGR